MTSGEYEPEHEPMPQPPGGAEERGSEQGAAEPARGEQGAAEQGAKDEQGAAEQSAAERASDEQAMDEPGATEPADGAADGAEDAAAAEPAAEAEPNDAAGPSRWWRRTIVAVLVALFAAYLLYRILHDGRLEQTALFYVGLPALVAISVASAARPRSAVGTAVVATTIGLALAGPLLGEGLVCLVFSAPLFYLVAVFVGLIVEAARKSRHRGVAAIAIIPVLLMCLEGVSPATSMPRGDTAVSERVVHTAPGDVERALASTPTYGRPTSGFLRLGFPRPLHATGEGLDVGDERFIAFTPRSSLGIGAEPTPRSMRLRVTESRPGKVVFTIVQDSTAARWLDFDTAEVSWRATGDPSTTTTVRWTLRYHRTFDPSWYFGPLQHYGMSRVADYLNDTITSPGTNAPDA